MKFIKRRQRFDGYVAAFNTLFGKRLQNAVKQARASVMLFDGGVL
jgi:hypothetical protein